MPFDHITDLYSFNYAGNKFKLAPKIIPYIPEHKTLLIAFSGALGLFLRKKPSKVEIINDLDSSLMTLYRVWRAHPQYLQEELLKFPKSREEFNALLDHDRYPRRIESRIKKLNPSDQELISIMTLNEDILFSPHFFTDLQRAVYKLVRVFYSHGSAQDSLGISRERRPNLSLKYVFQIAERLKRVTIENKDWKECLGLYDRKFTFTYCDPPYYSEGKTYIENELYTDYLRDIIQFSEDTGIKGKVLISFCRPSESTLELIKEYHWDTVYWRRKTHMDSNSVKEYDEWLIANYPLKKSSDFVKKQGSLSQFF